MFSVNAALPIATFASAVVFASKALFPIAMLKPPVVFAVNAFFPTATLLVPVVNESRAVSPIFIFVSVNPIPSLPAVIATPTLYSVGMWHLY